MSEIKTLRPGLLVSMRTSITGNVHYQRHDIEKDVLDEDGQLRASWETTRTVTDPVEHEAAAKVRGKAQSLVRSVCSKSEFGLLCPAERADELKAAVTAARVLASQFNEGAEHSWVTVSVIFGRIAQDDVEAVEAISTELRELMADMERGLSNLDVKTVREACNKAVGMGQMLSVDAKGRLDVAIKSARSAARRIVKAGEAVAGEIDQAALAQIAMARTSFLDLDRDDAVVAAPEISGREFEFATTEAVREGGTPWGSAFAPLRERDLEFFNAVNEERL